MKLIYPIVSGWKNHYVITGTGGARTDFVLNWLMYGHPKFHSIGRGWSMNSETGASTPGVRSPFNDIALTHEKVNNSAVNDIVAEMMKGHDPMATKNLVSKSHYRIKFLDDFVPEVLHDNTVLVSIITSNVNDDLKRKIVWEFLVKTFFKLPMNSLQDIIENEVNLGIIPALGDTEADSLMDIMAHRYIKTQRQVFDLADTYHEHSRFMPTIFLDFEKLIDTGGADYVCDQLGLDRTDHGRELWNRCLPMSHTPKTVRFLDREWSLDIIEDHAAKLPPDESMNQDPNTLIPQRRYEQVPEDVAYPKWQIRAAETSQGKSPHQTH